MEAQFKYPGEYYSKPGKLSYPCPEILCPVPKCESMPQNGKFSRKDFEYGLTVNYERYLDIKTPLLLARDIGSVLAKIKEENDPWEFKEYVLRLAQIYLDGLFEATGPYSEEEISVYNNVLDSVRLTVAGFYKRMIPFDRVRDCIEPYENRLSSCKTEFKIRHLIGKEDAVHKAAVSLSRALKKKDIDIIIPIASGGFEPAALCAEYLRIDNVLPIRYSMVTRYDYNARLPPWEDETSLTEKLHGKKVLVIDDIIGRGTTLSSVNDWVKEHGPKETYFGVVIGGGKDLNSYGLHNETPVAYLYSA